MPAFDPADVAREYARVRLTGWMLLFASVPLTAAAVFVDLHTAVSGFPWLYRWLFLAVAIVAGFACLLFHNILASPRPLRPPSDTGPARTIAAQVASLASVLLTMPFSVLLLGFAFRLVLGGTIVDYLGFLAITLALWALFFPRRKEFEEWVRLRTGPQE